MNRKVIVIISLLCFLITGCSCSKSDLVRDNQELKEKNSSIKEEIEEFKSAYDILNFYNTVTVEGINSLVLVQSKNNLTGRELFSNGVIVGFDGRYYYVVCDYNAIKQSTNNITYQVMDANAIVYRANIANAVDEENGLIILGIDSSRYTTNNLRRVKIGDMTDLLAKYSSVQQVNKLEMINKIKTSSHVYNDTSYVVYELEDNDPGSVLINEKCELVGIYLSKIDRYVSGNFLKAILSFTYSLNL